MRILELRLALVAAVLLSLVSPCLASVSARVEVTATRAPHELSLDPDLTDPAWLTGSISPSDFWNLTTHGPAQLPTKVYLLYDDRNLYVGFRAEQASAPIVALQSTNDVGFGLDDFVGVAIDTSGAGNQVYFFETTPGGIRYQQASDNARYKPRWRSVAKVVGRSWNAVLIIPLSALRLSNSTHPMWRLNFIRSIAALGEHYTWAYDGLMLDGPIGQVWPYFGDARYWPVLRLDDVSGAGRSAAKTQAQIYALASGGSDRDVFQQSNGTFAPQAVRMTGIDLTIPVTSTINAVGTLNPDFSNVEVDQQIIVPQEFQRQLQEYRPFFTQGAKFLDPSGLGFSTPTSPNNQIFYSPRIGSFDRGAKFEGTLGLESFGVLNFRGFDQITGNTFDDTAFGYKHALADRNFEWWFDGVDAHHSVAGNDATVDAGVLQNNPRNGFQWGAGQTVERGSWLPAPRVAHATNSFIGVFKPSYTVAFGYNDLSPNYNPIDGLTFNSDIRGFQGFAQALGATRWAKNYTITLNTDRWFDRSGAVHEADTLATLTATFNNGFSINNLGPSVGILRSYDLTANGDCSGPVVGRSSFTGFPCYRNGSDERFNLFQIVAGYKDGTPRPMDASYAFGPFAGNDTQILSLSTSRPIGRFSVGVEYDGTRERSFHTSAADSQWLRRLSLAESLGPDTNVSLSIRNINGLGGFAASTGTNVALGYHRRFASGNELFLDYGAPAAASTLHRLIVKYVYQIGGGGG